MLIARFERWFHNFLLKISSVVRRWNIRRVTARAQGHLAGSEWGPMVTMEGGSRIPRYPRGLELGPEVTSKGQSRVTLLMNGAQTALLTTRLARAGHLLYLGQFELKFPVLHHGLAFPLSHPSY